MLVVVTSLLLSLSKICFLLSLTISGEFGLGVFSFLVIEIWLDEFVDSWVFDSILLTLVDFAAPLVLVYPDS